MKRKTLVVGTLMLVSVLGCATWAHAATLSSDRNSEPDMKDYQVWICQTVNCVVVKSAATQSAAHALVEAQLFADSHVTHEELYRALKSLLLMQEACR